VSAAPLRWTASGRTDAGPGVNGGERRNDDHLLIDFGLGLFAVLDGGGNWFGPDEPARRGAEVIHQVVRTEPATTSPQTLIEGAFRTAGESLRGQLDADGEFGTATVVLLLLRGACAHVSWLGDSMAYRTSGDEIETLTRPHTVLDELLRRGEFTQEVAAMRNADGWSRVLARFLGGELPDPLEVVSFTPQPGDHVILTTDGVHDVLPADELLATCRSHPEPQACADGIVALARERGSLDNCTCAVIAFA
jgi:serine/threonine protein phosphatase PrpC